MAPFSWKVYVTDALSAPLDGVYVEYSTDSAKTNVVQSGYTASGNITFSLNAGTYYSFAHLDGYNFTQGVAITAAVAGSDVVIGTAVTGGARSGMADLITEMRSLCEAGMADYTLGASTFWGDEQIQACLDRYRNDIYDAEINAIPAYGTTITYQTYRIPWMNLESGTAVFKIMDIAGVQPSTSDYTVDYVRGIIEFAANTGGSIYYLSGRAYNLEAAAADVWRKKAGHAAAAFNFSAGGQSMSRSQIYDHCIERAKFFESNGGNHAESGDIDRADTPGSFGGEYDNPHTR